LENKSKINHLLRQWPRNAVYLTSWLEKEGYSSQLLNRYKKSNWISSIGSGAVIKTGDNPSIEGALFALQKQACNSIHPGGKTALSLLGKTHYLEFSAQHYTLFGAANEKLPGWMLQHHWSIKVDYHSSTFLPPQTGLIEKEMNGFSIKVSGAVRAMMECLYLTPDKQDIVECYELMEGLNNLRPRLVQELLVSCTSIKVKRLFLYLATKAGHSWLELLDRNRIDLGSGKRQLVDHGVYVPEFKITVPKALENGEL